MDIFAVLFREEDYVHGQSRIVPEPAQLGRRMAALYRCWNGRQAVNLSELTKMFVDRLGASTLPIGRACLATAAAVMDWHGHPYHSFRHHAEVATNAMVMTEIQARVGQAMPAANRMLLLAACLAHDIYYHPVTAASRPGAAETVSAQALDRIAEAYDVDADSREALFCFVLATEPGLRAELARMLRSTPHDVRPFPLHMMRLLREPGLAQTAAVLSDADLLSSSGLTFRWHRIQTSRLEAETGRPIDGTADLRFFDRVVGTDFLSPGGRHFSPNLAAIREHVALCY